MRLTKKCPTCSRVLELDHTETILNETLKVYRCGHAFSDEALKARELDSLDLISVDGKFKARPYQAESVKFVLDSNFSCIIGHQMRLGKTPISLLAARNSDRKPILVLARAANIYQWRREVNTWYKTGLRSVWVIQGTKNWIPPGFDIYIISMDTFGRKGMSDSLFSFGFQLVIADECHSFKNTNSQRSQALMTFLKNIERSELEQTWTFECPFDKERWDEQVTIQVDNLEAHKKTTKTSHCPKCFAQVMQSAVAHVKVTRSCGVIMLSGTPIKNKADEFFVPLNICAPDRFPSLQRFRRNYLVQNDKGQYSRIAPRAMDSFKQEISSFYLRYEKEDVYKDLPKFNRIFTPIEIIDDRLKKAYNQVLDEMEIEALQNGGSLKFFDSIGHLQKLRQICGLAKTSFVANYAEAFLMDSDRQKLVIGVHHHSVRDEMMMRLAHLGVLKLDGTDSPFQKDEIAHKRFPKSQEQILILGVLAAKEGLELPYIDTALVMEREWSSADEEQFEFRFYNPDKEYMAKIPEKFGINGRDWTNKVTNIEYVIAGGTIDEFFYDLVEEKRKIFGETIGTQWSVSDDPSSFKLLIERTMNNRLKVN